MHDMQLGSVILLASKLVMVFVANIEATELSNIAMSFSSLPRWIPSVTSVIAGVHKSLLELLKDIVASYYLYFVLSSLSNTFV